MEALDLAEMLAEWRVGWAAMHGREPEPGQRRARRGATVAAGLNPI